MFDLLIQLGCFYINTNCGGCLLAMRQVSFCATSHNLAQSTFKLHYANLFLWSVFHCTPLVLLLLIILITIRITYTYNDGKYDQYVIVMVYEVDLYINYHGLCLTWSVPKVTFNPGLFYNTEISSGKLSNHWRPFLNKCIHWVTNLHITGFVSGWHVSVVLTVSSVYSRYL